MLHDGTNAGPPACMTRSNAPLLVFQNWCAVQSSLALGPQEIPGLQPPPPESEPSPPSSASSAHEQDLSDEEDQNLMSLLQVRRHASVTGTVLHKQEHLWEDV